MIREEFLLKSDPGGVGCRSLGCPENAGVAETLYDAVPRSLIVDNNNMTTDTETLLLEFPNQPLWSNVYVRNKDRATVPLLWSPVQMCKWNETWFRKGCKEVRGGAETTMGMGSWEMTRLGDLNYSPDFKHEEPFSPDKRKERMQVSSFVSATIVFLWIILDISNDSIIRSIKVSPYIPLSKQQWGRGMTATMVFLWIIFDICTHSSIIQLQPFHKQHAPVFFWSSLLEFRFCVGYVNKCAPIYNLAIKGDWKEAKTMLAKDRRLATAAISQGWATLLHVAAEANHLHFVEELVKQLSEGELELQDHKGNIAFCFAAAVGNVKIAEAMARKNRSLPTIRGGEGLTPLHLAALQGKSEMAWYLYTDTVRNLNHKFDDADWSLLFFLCINTGIYDLALKMLQENPRLAVARNENKETSLHVLARKPSAFSCQGRSTFKLNISKSFLRRALADDHKISLCNAHFADNRDFSHCLIAKEKQKLFARLRRICQYTQHPKKLWAWHLGLV